MLGEKPVPLSCLPQLVPILIFGSLVADGGPVPVTYYVIESGTPELGRPHNLTCYVGGPPVLHFDPFYFWVKDGSVLPRKTDQTLAFPSLTRQDGGVYQCGSNHANGGEETKRLSQPHVLNILRLDNMTLTPAVYVVDGLAATLHCSVDSVPTALLTWEIDGKTVRKVQANSDSLVIESPSLYLGRVCVCQATNPKLPHITLTREATLQQAATQSPSVPPSNHPDANVVTPSARFHFVFPSGISATVIHPSGKGMFNYSGECVYRVWGDFLARQFVEECDRSRNILILTREKVTGKDAGEYVCMERGPEGTIVPDCKQTLILDGADVGKVYGTYTIVIIILVVLLLSQAIPVLNFLKKGCLSKCHGAGAGDSRRKGKDCEMTPLSPQEASQNATTNSITKEQLGKTTSNARRRVRRARQKARYKTHPPSSSEF